MLNNLLLSVDQYGFIIIFSLGSNMDNKPELPR